VTRHACGEPGNIMKKQEEEIRDLITAAIYHGRHFSPKRDDIVTKKSVDYVLKMLNRAAMAGRRDPLEDMIEHEREKREGG